MNRRDFCFSLGAAVAGGLAVLGDPASGDAVASSLCGTADQRALRFRAKKVFLESWNSDGNTAASFVRNQLNDIRRDGCNGLILVPGRDSCTAWTQLIVSEASRMELTTLVPVRLTRDFLREVSRVFPLAQEKGILSGITTSFRDGQASCDGGFLLVNGSDSVFGLVLYDPSRCLWTGFGLWTGFAESGNALSLNTTSRVERCDNADWRDADSQLTAARWIDHVRLSFSKNLV